MDLVDSQHREAYLRERSVEEVEYYAWAGELLRVCTLRQKDGIPLNSW